MQMSVGTVLVWNRISLGECEGLGSLFQFVLFVQLHAKEVVQFGRRAQRRPLSTKTYDHSISDLPEMLCEKE